jgi:hypothetical protein
MTTIFEALDTKSINEDAPLFFWERWKHLPDKKEAMWTAVHEMSVVLEITKGEAEDWIRRRRGARGPVLTPGPRPIG